MWIYLRCISFCLDEANRQLSWRSVYNFYGYVFYLPCFFLGPVLLYYVFANQVMRYLIACRIIFAAFLLSNSWIFLSSWIRNQKSSHGTRSCTCWYTTFVTYFGCLSPNSFYTLCTSIACCTTLRSVKLNSNLNPESKSSKCFFQGKRFECRTWPNSLEIVSWLESRIHEIEIFVRYGRGN